MEYRTFQLDGQWCMIHYPFKPSGFGVLLIGGRRAFVEKDTSYWLEHPGRYPIAEHLRSEGYTLFTSNFYSPNWGSVSSAELAAKLYHLMQKSEILNEKIFIAAEGSGAMTAMKLMGLLKEHIRCAVFINPILTLNDEMDKEKHNKFFYKKWLSEAAAAYQKSPADMETYILETENSRLDKPQAPIEIIHVLDHLSENRPKLYDAFPDGSPVSVSYFLPEQRYKIPGKISRFFKQHEHPL